MSTKTKGFLATACMAIMTVGFSLSAYAFNCENCLNGCEIERQICINSGQFTLAQCNASFVTCWGEQCGFCELP